MNANFLRAMKQYEDLRTPAPAAYYPPQADPYAPPPQSQAYQPYPPQAQPHQPYPPHQASAYPQQPAYPSQNSYHGQPPQDGPPGPHQYQTLGSAGQDYPAHMPGRQSTDPGQASVGAGQAPYSAEEHKAAWDAYYAQQGQGQGQGQPPAPYPKDDQSYQPAGYGHSAQGAYPGQGYPQGQQGVDGVAAGMGRMSVNGA